MMGYQLIKKKTLEGYKTKIEALENTIAIASAFIAEIGKGNLEVNYQSLQEEDVLRASLLEMKKQLKAIEQEDYNTKWVNEGLALFATILRIRYTSMNEFSDAILQNLVNYLGINQGGLFLYKEEESMLELSACYAYNRKKYLEKRVRPGEGILGEAFLEKETIYMTEVPDKYTTITSGLGEATPNALLVVPLKYNDSVVGVLELASFSNFEAHKKMFVEKIAESTATAIFSLTINENTEKLLQETREQTESLRAQEEEMRQNIEELQATQEKTENIGEELKHSKVLLEKTLLEHEEESSKMLDYMEGYKKMLIEILDELPQKVFVKDQEGKFILVNTAVAQAHHLSIEKLINTSDFDYFSIEDATKYRAQELEIINAKKSITFIHEETISGKKRILKTVKRNIHLHHLEQENGLLGIQTDITELKDLEAKLRDFTDQNEQIN